MMMVGDGAHCADAVAGSAKTAAANRTGRTLVICIASNSNDASDNSLTPLPDNGILIRARCRALLAE